MKPPTPVDVSPADLRSGRFQMNPRRRTPLATIVSWAVPWAAGYIAGKLIALAFPVLHAPPWWQRTALGLLAMLAAVPIFQALQSRLAAQVVDIAASFLVGLIVGVTA